jgi:xylan 1,4-beta-xylosidase
MKTRRDIIKTTLLTAAAAAAPTGATGGARGGESDDSRRSPGIWRRGVENQRVADLGDGTFLNPVLAGDFADPTVLRDGDEYFMTNTSHDANPGILLWRSRDLVNWRPIGPVLFQPLGSVWAMDLIKHEGRYFIYIPATPNGQQTILVMHASRIEGPWSDPIDLKIPAIDPGHVVGEDGKRYLFVNGGRRVPLTDDGLATAGALEHAYELWRYPEDWVVEMYAPEGPKFFWRDGFLYLIAAVGGTAGPPTSHMVVVSRSRSVHGPWEQCPHNPIVRTTSEAEPWWSRGHATIVEGPAGGWWMVYHGYENGYRTLGRQVLLEPVTWDDHGWPHAAGGDLSLPLAKPAGGRTPATGRPLSDDFTASKFGVQWRFFKPSPNEMARVRYDNGALVVAAKGRTPADCAPMTFSAGDHAYEIRVTLDDLKGAQGGMLLFYNERAYFGFGFDGRQMFTHVYGAEQDWMRMELRASRLYLRLTNDRQIVTMHYSTEGNAWTKHPWQFELSGVHQNVLGGFLSLCPALYACGAGDVRFREFRYRALA